MQNTAIFGYGSHILIEVIKLDTQELLRQVYETGTPIAFIAKNIGKDPSTLQKWMRGTSPYFSEKAQEELIQEIKRIKKLWENINI